MASSSSCLTPRQRVLTPHNSLAGGDSKCIKVVTEYGSRRNTPNSEMQKHSGSAQVLGHISTATNTPNVWARTANTSRDCPPLLSKVLDCHAWNDGGIACGVAGMRWFRAQMEDSASILLPLTASSKDKYRFCGVFDGHAQSRKVASTLEELLPRRIGEQKQKLWMSREGLEMACTLVDKDILRSEYSDAGSTAIFCVLEKTDSVKITLGSIGDSQAMIIHSDFSRPPTVPFVNEINRPHLMESEMDRIKRAGGFIANNRVDGELAVSRAFGDAKYKRNISRKLNEQKVVAIPSVTDSIPFNVGDILVLGCDGLFDFMTPAHIDTFIRGTLISVLVKLKKED